MRFVNYRRHGDTRIGVLLEDRIIDVNRVLQLKLQRSGVANSSRLAFAQAPPDALAFIAAGQDGLDVIGDAVDWIESQSEASDDDQMADMGIQIPISQVGIAPPIPRPGKIICLGLNYRDHAIEAGDPIPDYPVYFPKYSNCVIGPGENIVIPKVTKMVDYEVELAFIIGRRGRNIDQNDAMNHVFGYTVVNDVSAREYQRRSSQWAAGKVFDTFLPMGPHIVTVDEVGDPHSLSISCKINDEVRQDSSTNQMIFTIPAIIKDLSEIMTLEPGDIVTTGTPPGVGSARKPPVWLAPSDTVSVEVEGIGVLVNSVIAEQ